MHIFFQRLCSVRATWRRFPALNSGYAVLATTFCSEQGPPSSRDCSSTIHILLKASCSYINLFKH